MITPTTPCREERPPVPCGGLAVGSGQPCQARIVLAQGCRHTRRFFFFLFCCFLNRGKSNRDPTAYGSDSSRSLPLCVTSRRFRNCLIALVETVSVYHVSLRSSS